MRELGVPPGEKKRNSKTTGAPVEKKPWKGGLKGKEVCTYRFDGRGEDGFGVYWAHARERLSDEGWDGSTLDWRW
ncbi:hypothetical protein NPIL_152731 [Nephila pilipes]|uniref:Uncharacterized protein n=1 Tax=Nephila pilipes TaxID=299642 RepID=A0A8X6T3F4_NEPPI|nr:hypothetical protein NPIL_152731 [Nephila pilipes]